MKTVIHTSTERGHVDFGWLNSYHSFSFGHYHNPAKTHFGKLRVLNDDVIKGGKGFDTHPHDNMEIISIPVYGALEHKDSTGWHEVIRQFDVQIMSAGSGIMHSEFNHSKEEDANFLQLWIFPKEKNITPRYEQKNFLPEDRVNKLQTVVAPDKNDGAVWINQDAWLSLGNFDSGYEFNYNVKQQGNGVYIFVLSGTIEVDEMQLHQRDAIGIWDNDRVVIKTNSNAELLLIDVPMN